MKKEEEGNRSFLELTQLLTQICRTMPLELLAVMEMLFASSHLKGRLLVQDR